MDTFSYHQDNIKDLAIKTIWYSQDFYHLLSEELDARIEGREINQHMLFAYQSSAYSTFMAFKLYYLQNSELAHSEFDDFIESFERFNNEFLSSRSTGHNMQHTFLYYGELVDAYNCLADLLKLSHIEVPE